MRGIRSVGEGRAYRPTAPRAHGRLTKCCSRRQLWPAIFWPGYTAATLFKRHGAASCSFTMISFANINKQYGKQLLFVDASFQLNPGEKVGLVGPNGAGKTTLFRMVVGEETPDEGAVSIPKKLTIGYFRQDVEEMQGRSVLDEAIAGSGRVGDLHHELEALS